LGGALMTKRTEGRLSDPIAPLNLALTLLLK
jgi:hypothetical protein